MALNALHDHTPMTAEQILAAIDEVDSVYISVHLVNGGGPILIRWRDKSLAIRRKVRTQVRGAARNNPRIKFNARMLDGIDKVLIVGEV